MNHSQAEKEAMQMMSSGMKHQTYEDEMLSSSCFELEHDEFIRFINSPLLVQSADRYIDVLAPTPLRAIKNGSICLITVICRIAIDYGVEVELSYSLSDYYIFKLESLSDVGEVVEQIRDIMLHYYELINSATRNIYEKNISRAVRFIERNIYGSCTVADVAKYVGLEPHYFSTLFKSEVGSSPSVFIRKRKLKEARRILTRTNSSVTQTAEALGFCNTAHFTNCFKEEYGILPSALSRRDAVRDMHKRRSAGTSAEKSDKASLLPKSEMCLTEGKPPYKTP